MPHSVLSESGHGLGLSKRATMHTHSSRGCKSVTWQSWRFEKNCLAEQSHINSLSKKQGCDSLGRILFGPPTFSGNSLAASWAVIMHSSSNESPKQCSFALFLIKSVAAFLAILFWLKVFTPIYMPSSYLVRISA